jgi:hypothetical protein
MIKWNSPKQLLGIGLFAIVSCAVLFLVERSDDDPTLEPKMAPALQWRLDRLQNYSFTVDSSSLIEMPGSNAGQLFTVVMNGEFEYRALEHAPAEVLVGIQMSSLEIEVGGNSPADPVLRELTLPFRVRMAPDGRPIEFEFSASVSLEARQIMENLIRMFQVSIQPGDEWIVQETDASGLFVAKYTRNSPSTIIKTKQRYIDSGQSSAGAVSVVRSLESITIDSRQYWISGLDVDEVLRIENPQSFSMEVSNRATLELRGSRASAGRATGKWHFVTAAPAVASPVHQLPPEEAKVELRSALASLDTTDGTRTGDIHRLRDLVRMDSKLPSILVDDLRTKELTDRTRADVYLVLQLAGTPEAQAALSLLAADADMPVNNSLRAIVALGSVQNPTEETIEVLWDSARSGVTEGERRDVPTTATLALGSVANGLRNADNDNYSILRADLMEGASGASDDRQRAVYLLALGNTADTDPTMSRDIVVFLDDPAPEVRSAAANALGRLATNQVGGDLFKRLENERNDAVRSSITEALLTWENPSPGAVATFRTAIPNESSENTRYNMARFLGKTMDTSPENREALESLLETERSKRIRQEIANTLYGGR